MKWTKPSDFDWDEDPPLSSSNVFMASSIVYVALVLVATAMSKLFLSLNSSSDALDTAGGRNKTSWKPWFGSDMKKLQTIRNINLVGSSAVMLVGVLYEVWKRANAEGRAFFLLCEDPSTARASGAIYYWSYIYYLSKYYELLDTVLQLCRGKPPPHFLLHVYHHAAVLIMAWGWVETKQSLQFIGLAFNTAVHVVMYTYFLQRTMTSKVPRWKNFVTQFQIFQFFFSFVATLFTLYYVFVKNYQCAGMKALFFNVLFNLTLFYSFIGVLSKGKKKKSQ